MFPSRTKILALSCLLLAVIVCCALYFYKHLSRNSSITFAREDLARIEDDMTESDVEKVVGLPPGNYCTDDQITETFYQYYVDRRLPDLPHKEWMSDGGMIQIIFKDGKVMRKSFYAPILPRRSWLEQIRDRLGL